MLVIAARALVDPADLEKAMDAGRIMAEKSQAEPGCITYCFSQDLNNPNLIRIFEEWESQEDLDKHFQMPHMAEFQATLQTLNVKEIKAKKYDVSGVTDMV